MPQIRDPQPLPPRSTPSGKRPWRTVQLVLGAALVAGGAWAVGTRLLLMLFHTPGMLYAELFIGGERAAAAGAQFHQALVEGVVLLIAAAYGVVLVLCGAMNWRLVKASLWFCGLVAVLAAAFAFKIWRGVAAGGG